MDLNDLLTKENIDPRQVIVLRHRPQEPELRKVLPWLAAEKPDVFNAYQQTQPERLEKSMLRAKYIASFIGTQAGNALFIGIYSIGELEAIRSQPVLEAPCPQRTKVFGMEGFSGKVRPTILWFDLALKPFYASWKGKLIIGWPPPERSWYRWAERNTFPVQAILEDSALNSAMPAWDEIDLGWEELRVLPTRWRAALLSR